MLVKETGIQSQKNQLVHSENESTIALCDDHSHKRFILRIKTNISYTISYRRAEEGYDISRGTLSEANAIPRIVQKAKHYFGES